MVGLAIGAVAASAGSSLIGAGLQSSAAKSAASTQAGAALQAAQMQQAQYQQTRSDLLPYNQTGQSDLSALSAFQPQAQNALTGAWNTAQAAIPQQITAQNIGQLPGYQFNLSQGLQAVQNSQAAKGLGVSGAALKQAAQFAEGTANNYANDYFTRGQGIYNDQSQQFSNLYNQTGQGFNQLLAPAQLGESAAAQAGSIGQAGAAAAGSNIAGAGQAIAAGTTASANAIANGLNTAAQAPLNYLLLSNALKTPSGGATGGGLG